MTKKREVVSKDVSGATLKELRAILAKTPEAAKIFNGEIDRRWRMIPIEQRRWVCKLAGVPGAEEKSYTGLPSVEKTKVRAVISRLKLIVSAFDFALSQW